MNKTSAKKVCGIDKSDSLVHSVDDVKIVSANGFPYSRTIEETGLRTESASEKSKGYVLP